MEIPLALYRFCLYQERSQQEVRKKLYAIGYEKSVSEEIIANLIEKDLINEERFAKAVAKRKFHMKHWGKNKIIQRLREHQISAYCINIALMEISGNEYEQRLQFLLEKKWKELKNQKSLETKNKLLRYLLQKGYNSKEVYSAINKTITK